MINIADLILRVRSICDLREVALRKHGQILESTIESSSLVLAEDLYRVALRAQPEAVLDEFRRWVQGAICLRVLIDSADNDARRGFLAAISDLGGLSEDASDAFLQFLAGSVDRTADGAVKCHDVARYVGVAIAVTRERCVAEPAIETGLCGRKADGCGKKRKQTHGAL